MLGVETCDIMQQAVAASQCKNDNVHEVGLGGTHIKSQNAQDVLGDYGFLFALDCVCCHEGINLPVWVNLLLCLSLAHLFQLI